MRFTRRTVLGASASAASLAVLAACSKGDGSDGGATSGGAGDNKEIASNASDMNPKSREELGQGGVLRLTNNAYPANWNTFHADGNEANTNTIMGAVWPSLLKIDPEGKPSPDTQYCKRIDLKSEDPQVVEVELRDGMKWSDGTPIDWQSVKNVFDVMSGKDAAFQISSSTGYDQVEKVEAGANNLTAKITFKSKYADWISLPGVMPMALAKSAEEFNKGWVQAPKITAGPFKVAKADPNNKTVLLEPDPNFWGDKPMLKQILFTTIEAPAAAATSFNNGQLDAFNATVPAMYTAVKGKINSGAALRKAAGPNWTHLTLNGAPGRPLADKAVRQAIFRAIDREKVFLSINAAMPYPKKRVQLNNHVLMPNQDGYKDNSGEFGKYDPAAAKKILTDAGYKIEGDKAMKDGKPLEITYVYNDGSKTNEAVVPVVQEQLAAVGIKLNVQKVPPTDLFAKYINPGQFDITLFGWNGNPFLSSGDAIWKSKGQQNFGKVGDAEVDKMVDEAASETDKAKRLELVNKYDAKLWELAGTFPLWQSYDFWVQDKDLANFGARGMATTDWTKVGYVKDSAKLKG